MMFSLWVLAVCCTLAQGFLTPPQISYYPSNDLDNEDDVKATKDFKITCNVTGSLPMTFKWKVNGQEVAFAFFGSVLFDIIPNPMKNKTSLSSTIIIKRPSPDADGKYQCEAKNAAGGTFTRKLRVKVTYTNGFVKGQNAKAEVVDVTEGRPTRLACPPREKKFKPFGVYYNWGRKTPAYVANFLTDKAPNRALLPNGDLLFLFLSKDDLKEIADTENPFKGLLQCNAVASSNHWSHALKLNKVGVDNSEFAAKFDRLDDYPKTIETAVQGKPKKLSCIAIGNPVPKISWIRLEDDKRTIMKEIKHGEDGFEFVGQYRRTLLIPLVSKEQHERGYYQCVAQNKLDMVKSAPTKLKVFVAPRWTSKPEKMKPIPVQGNDKLLCEAVGTPPPTYKWYHNGTAFTSDNELAPNIVVDGKLLKFSKIERYHEGVFQCAVENDWGMLVSGTWVRVKAHKPGITDFGPFYIFKETTATLNCDSNAAPAADHVWKKDDKVLEIKGRYSLGVNNSLVIKDVVSADEGKYTCDAKNDLGTDSASAPATVYERTKIIKPQASLTNVFITLNKPLDLHCEATADPRLKPFLKYKWLKDGAEMKNNKRVYWDLNDKLLEIKNANVLDGAKYSCVAYIDAKQKSQDTIAYIANVKGVPFPPSDLKITGCGNMSTTISWKKGKDGDFPTTRYIVEQESTYEPDKWEVLVNITDTTKTSFFLKLTAYADLAFRMRAINKIGPSRASAPTPKGKCITPKFRPTMYPENLRGIPGKAHELDIAWKPMTKLQANGPNLRYILFYRKADKQDWEKIIIRDHTVGQFSVPNAGYYIKWEFKIIAENDIDKGPFSNIKWSFSGQDAPKGKPKNVKIGKITARTIELTWDRVDVDGRGSVDGYKIYFWGQSKSDSKSTSARRRREIPAAANVFEASQTTEDTQKAVVTGLNPYHSYTLALKAFNSGGEGPESDEITFDTKEDVPGEVKSFEAYAFSSYIFASWGEPKEKNGVLLGYTIAAVKHKDKEPVQPAPSEVIDIKTNSFEFLFTKMDPESRYVVYLRAKTIVGPGPVLMADLKTIAPAKPSGPRAPIVQANSTTAVNVTFLFGTTPGGYPTKFKVKYRETEPKNLSFKETGWFDHLDKRWTIVGGLAKDSLHEFVTVGSNDLGESKDSPPTFGRPMPAVGSGKRVSTPFYKTPWFIILMVLIILLLLVLLIVILVTRRRGAKYPVGKREKARAGILENEPDEDNVDMGRMIPPPYRSKGSLDKHNSDDDSDSLDDYEEGPQFKEDGSFIEEYGDDRKKLTDDKEKEANATFV